MGNAFKELPGLRVEIEDVIFMPHLEAPEDKPYPFVYFVAIVNDSQMEVTIQGRKWIVKEDSGETSVVEGRGVVGENPVIQPGQRFTYNSYHVVKSKGSASGAFFGIDEKGEGIRVTIPPFDLKVPEGV